MRGAVNGARRGLEAALLAVALAHAPAPARAGAADGLAGAATALAAEGDPAALASAAALAANAPGAGASGATALELATRAAALDPDDPSLAWLRLQICQRTAGCDVRDIATTMRWTDADNAAAWLPTLSAAERDRDGQEIDRVLAAMARDARFDLYWNRVVVMLFDALARVRGASPRLASDHGRLAAATGAATRLLPQFRALKVVCRGAGDPERRENCRRLGRTMQHSDTIVAQLTGLSLEKHGLAADSREARQCTERQRTLEWRLAQADALERPVLPWLRNAHARSMVARMRVLPRQEDALSSLLRQYRVPVEPPPDAPK